MLCDSFKLNLVEYSTISIFVHIFMVEFLTFCFYNFAFEISKCFSWKPNVFLWNTKHCYEKHMSFITKAKNKILTLYLIMHKNNCHTSLEVLENSVRFLDSEGFLEISNKSCFLIPILEIIFRKYCRYKPTNVTNILQLKCNNLFNNNIWCKSLSHKERDTFYYHHFQARIF